MAAPLPPTLGDLRQSVAIRAGLATNGTLNTSLLPLIDDQITSAQKQILLRASWARLQVTETIILAAGQRDYDLPPSAGAIGDVQQLLLENEDGTRSQLRYDDSWTLTASQTMAETAGRPTTWAYIDDVIRLNRVPDVDTYPAIIATSMKGETQLKIEQDRAAVDGEAIIMLATIGVKKLLGVDFDLESDFGDFVQYLKDLRSSRAGPGREIDMASQRATGVAYWDAPTAGFVGLGTWPDWNPW